jgi:hypothetical protein
VGRGENSRGVASISDGAILGYMNFAILNPFKTGNYDQYLNSTGSFSAARRKP